jgi:hypothetical protein
MVRVQTVRPDQPDIEITLTWKEMALLFKWLDLSIDWFLGSHPLPDGGKTYAGHDAEVLATVVRTELFKLLHG